MSQPKQSTESESAANFEARLPRAKPSELYGLAWQVVQYAKRLEAEANERSRRPQPGKQIIDANDPRLARIARASGDGT